MNRRRTGRRLLPLLCLLSLAAAAGQAQEHARHGRTPGSLSPYARAVEPYRRFFLTPPEYRGPSRDKPFAEGVEGVPIGVLAPLEGTPDDELGASLLHGVELAIEEANDQGGYGGLPFEVVARNDQALWGSSSNTLVQFAYDDRVWALIGSIDSNSTHVALRVALKAELPMVNVGSTDPTVTETSIPWIIRTTPDDRQTGYRLARHLFEDRGARRVAVVRASDRYGRFGIREFRDAARRLGYPLAMELLFPPGSDDYSDALAPVAAASVDALVLWASAEDAARIVRQAREAGFDQPIFATDRVVSERFVELAGSAAEGVEATAWMDPTRTDSEWQAFVERFRQRFGRSPDVWAAYAYDAAWITVGAIRDAGLNHARIMDALGSIREYRGIAAPMIFDTTWSNVAEPLMVRLVDGRFVPLSGGEPPVAEPVAVAVPATGEPLRVGLLAAEDVAGEGLAAGARAAVEEINAAGGINGRPLELSRLAAGSPWRDGASRVAQLAATEELIALIGAADGALAHVAAQLATRRQIPYLSASAEVSLTQAGVPWVMRAVPSDRAQAAAALATLGAAGAARVALVVPSGREGRERLAALRAACAARGARIVEERVVEERTSETAGPLPQVDAVMLWLDPEPAIRLLERFRPAGLAPLLGSHRLAERAVLDRAAALGHTLRLPASVAPGGGDFSERLGYDLVRRVAAAARTAGIAPAALRDALLADPEFVGRTGAMRFDAAGNRIVDLEPAVLPGSATGIADVTP